MELDELKQQWKHADANQTSQNKNIMEMIQHSSNGPVAALKTSYKRQIGLMALMPIVLILTNFANIETTLSSVLFWTYTAFCFAVVIFAGYNYKVVKQMEDSGVMVKPHLERMIRFLETSMQRNVTGVRIAMLFFIVLTEVLPYIQHFRMLDAWHGLSPLIRYGTYALLVLLQYFSVKRMSYIKFGQHIERLKGLVRQMED
jgi:hypothetical protein